MRSSVSGSLGSGSGFYWVVSPDLIAHNLDRWTDAFMDGLDKQLAEVGVRIASWAKANHPFANITGEAERAITSKVYREGGNRIIILWYDPSVSKEGASHGFFMEIRWDGKYGVIRVALESHYDDVMTAVRNAIKQAG